MTHRLPPVLSPGDFPLAELTAARLDGELYCVDDGFIPIDEVEHPAHRARALGAGVPDRIIAEQSSAAWVWGALDTPPRHHQFCAAIGARVSRSSVQWCTVREVVIDESEIVAFDTLAVTTPLRTAVDLLRFTPDFSTREQRIVRRLMILGEFSALDCELEMSARRNLPNKRRALLRLRQIG
jgi:hypothetical protein